MMVEKVFFNNFVKSLGCNFLCRRKLQFNVNCFKINFGQGGGT